MASAPYSGSARDGFTGRVFRKETPVVPPADDRLAAVAPLARTLHRLDEAHRRFRGLIARDLLLSSIELTALLLIADTPGTSPGALGQDLGISTGATTALVDRLEDSGHVHRVPNPIDRRRLELQLTDAGLETLRAMATSYRTVLADADIDGSSTQILPQLDSITAALNSAARAQ